MDEGRHTWSVEVDTTRRGWDRLDWGRIRLRSLLVAVVGVRRVMLKVDGSAGGVGEAVAEVVVEEDHGQAGVVLEERIVKVDVRQRGHWKRLDSWVGHRTFVRLRFLRPSLTERAVVLFATLVEGDGREEERAQVQHTLHTLAVTEAKVAVVVNRQLRLWLLDTLPAHSHDCLAFLILSPHSTPAMASVVCFHSDPTLPSSSSHSYTSCHTCPNSSYADYSDLHVCSPYRCTLDTPANREGRREVCPSATVVDLVWVLW